MFKNFSPQSLTINGRQSELIELALTYGFKGMDVDMHEMYRRNQRSENKDASKYLDAAKKSFNIKLGTFDSGLDLDADEDSYSASVGALGPIAEMAAAQGVSRASVKVPASTDRLPYHEYFAAITDRLGKAAEVFAPHDIKLAVAFQSGKELAEGKEFEFVRNVEGFISLVRGVGNAGVGFYIDTWDWVVGDGAMDQLSELKAEEIVAVRIGSIPEDVDVSKAESWQKLVPTAEGPVNHVKLIAHLNSIGYDGPLSPAANGRSYKGQTRESIVQAGQEAVDAICTEAGMEVTPLPKDSIDESAYETAPAI
ncbi:MAG: TIM barrel protein [Planctomycetota bacterium]